MHDFWTSEKIGGQVNLTWSLVRWTSRHFSLFLSLKTHFTTPAKLFYSNLHQMSRLVTHQGITVVTGSSAAKVSNLHARSVKIYMMDKVDSVLKGENNFFSISSFSVWWWPFLKTK